MDEVRRYYLMLGFVRMGEERKRRKLKEKLNEAIRREKHAEALDLYAALEQEEPAEPRWPHRKGDLLVKLKQSKNAISAYERAVTLYAQQGFVARAAAMAKVVLRVDPSRTDVLERVDPEAARRLHREARQRNTLSVSEPLPPISSSRGSAASSHSVSASGSARNPTAPSTAPASMPPRSGTSVRSAFPLPRPGISTFSLPPKSGPPAMPPPPPSSAHALGSATPSSVSKPPPTPSDAQVFTEDMSRETRSTQEFVASAVPLIQATSKVDEVRFTSPPTKVGNTLEIEISPLEFSDRESFSVGRDSIDKLHPSAEELAELPAMPLFAEVPQGALSILVRESSLIDLRDGDVLYDVGNTADSLYTLIEGTVEERTVLSAHDKSANGKSARISKPMTFSEGDVVGLSCLLEHVEYDAQLIAVGQVRALRTSKMLLDRIVAEYPSVGTLLLETLCRRLVANFMRSSPLVANFNRDTKVAIARMFEVRRATPKTDVIVAGKRSDGVYIPLLGQFDALDKNGVLQGNVKLGQVLGQESVIAKVPASVTVRAMSEVLLLRMDGAEFVDFADNNPQTAELLRQAASAQLPTEVAVVASSPTSTASR